MNLIDKIKKLWDKILDKFKSGKGYLTFEEMAVIDTSLANHFVRRR